VAGPPERHVDSIPVNWKAIEEETRQDSNWNEWEDCRPIDTAPLLDGLSEGREAAKDKVLDA
jgi:hypothetical protein